ncbi:hypothetical protein DOZ80_30000 [Pseudomonas fluorescens]|uniref:Adhesin n=1 Tax=Pseudomonas fluorescens TaxID=294 RepID=A0A327MIM6_PSEFL|nr:CS1 type fimbrial major subunit [Pseudomonas fluorescens]RAI62647.1 hypothetical protein DOZ80_30000 [Pseudomonas fluorescens]
MFKKIAMSTSVLALALASSAALAVPQQHDITVVADIPGADFYVQPEDMSTIRDEQRLLWNQTTSKLEGISPMFKVKSSATSGAAPAVKATLMEAAEIVDIADSTKKISLGVSFNGVPLTSVGTAVEVVPEDGATTEQRMPLVITPVEPAAPGYVEGNYRGFVKVMFDAP